MEYVRKVVFQYFPAQQADTKKDWGECAVAIDESCRRLKNKPIKKEISLNLNHGKLELLI